jgi:hypothetical protein
MPTLLLGIGNDKTYAKISIENHGVNLGAEGLRMSNALNRFFSG